MIDLITAWLVWLWLVPYVGWFLAAAFAGGIAGFCILIAYNLIGLVMYLYEVRFLIAAETFCDKELTITKNLLNLALVAFLIRLMLIIND